MEGNSAHGLGIKEVSVEERTYTTEVYIETDFGRLSVNDLYRILLDLKHAQELGVNVLVYDKMASKWLESIGVVAPLYIYESQDAVRYQCCAPKELDYIIERVKELLVE